MALIPALSFRASVYVTRHQYLGSLRHVSRNSRRRQQHRAAQNKYAGVVIGGLAILAGVVSAVIMAYCESGKQGRHLAVFEEDLRNGESSSQ